MLGAWYFRRPAVMRRFLFVPILLASFAVVALLVALGPEPEAQEFEPALAEVQVQSVRLDTQRVTVTVDGTARPARRTAVAARVAGEIVWAATSLRAGTRVEQESPLFRIRQTRYTQAAAEARSRLAEAELRLLREQAAAEMARTEWERTGAEPDPLALGVPQLAAAEEGAAAARAALETAETDLRNTEVQAPHAGLVASRSAEVGEWVTPGHRLLELFSLDVFEVRVSLPDAALSLVDLPFRESGGRMPPARVTATLGPPDAEVRWTWEGRLARMEGEMDPATRFIPAVIEVAEPYRTTPDGRPPLVAGMFVRVEIEGREFPDVATVPVSAFRADGTVLVVDAEDRIRVREVDAFWPAGETAVLVRSGLAAGERLVVSPPSMVAEGMRVRIAGSPEVAAPSGGGASGSP
ncbi:MAG: efflux RND transporter periplasmic adaptor subunit [Acidobacteria bacterium]|nr:efflux RND transporter periplasmic adaptor subunit [Acidobacteriota bacterium]